MTTSSKAVTDASAWLRPIGGATALVANLLVLGTLAFAALLSELSGERKMRSFLYRGGDPVRVADLERVDVERAKRILVLGTGGEEPDARVIATILAVRGRSPRAALFADLEHEKNFAAARAAGGPRTRVVGSGPFLGLYVAVRGDFDPWDLARYLLAEQ